MANECETSIVFYSEHKAMIKDLWRNIISFCKDNHDCTIYKFMQKRGYSKNDLYQSDKRGAITYCDSSVTYKDDIVYFKIETVSAWMPQVDEFYKLIDEKYDRKISIVFETEEQVELLLNAIEKSKKNNKSNTLVNYECISGDRIKEMFN